MATSSVLLSYITYTLQSSSCLFYPCGTQYFFKDMDFVYNTSTVRFTLEAPLKNVMRDNANTKKISCDVFTRHMCMQ